MSWAIYCFLVWVQYEVEATSWDFPALTQPRRFLSPRFQVPSDENVEHRQNMYDEGRDGEIPAR